VIAQVAQGGTQEVQYLVTKSAYYPLGHVLLRTHVFVELIK